MKYLLSKYKISAGKRKPTRIAGVVVGFYWGYQIGYAETYNPIAQLHFMIPVIIVSIAGTSGLASLFFGNDAAKINGYDVGSNY